MNTSGCFCKGCLRILLNNSISSGVSISEIEVFDGHPPHLVGTIFRSNLLYLNKDLAMANDHSPYPLLVKRADCKMHTGLFI